MKVNFKALFYSCNSKDWEKQLTRETLSETILSTSRDFMNATILDKNISKYRNRTKLERTRKLWYPHFVGHETKGRISKRVLRENKGGKKCSFFGKSGGICLLVTSFCYFHSSFHLITNDLGTFSLLLPRYFFWKRDWAKDYVSKAMPLSFSRSDILLTHFRQLWKRFLITSWFSNNKSKLCRANMRHD